MTSTAREYLRVSSDRSGRARSVEEQHEDNRRAGQEHGFQLNGEAYSDVSVSASRFARQVRGGFARLLADLKAGQFGADVLVMWESSRGSRRVGEWATLVDRLEDARVKVHVTTHGRTYDPANARDRRTLMEDAVDSEYESGKTSARIRRAAAASAAEGRPHGRVPYGFRRRYDPVTRRLIAQEPDPLEAPVVAELYERLRKGHALAAIAADYAARGIRTRSGRPWSPQHLRDLAIRPIYGGLRVHRPGSRSGRHDGPLTGAVTATWPALVPAATFHAVREMLLRPDRRTRRPGRAVHLLSLIARCDVCGGPMVGVYRTAPGAEIREYRCRRGCVRIGADDLDEHGQDVMLAYLAQPDLLARLRDPSGDARLARVRDDLACARAELAALRAAAGAGKVTVATLLAVEPGLAARVETLESQERELATPPALAGLMAPGKDVRRRWRDAPMPARREVARMLCTPAVLGALRVARGTRGHRVAAFERVKWARDST